MKGTPRVPGDGPIMAVGYRYISNMVLGFFNTEGSGSTELGVSYLSHYPEKFVMFLFTLLFVLV